MPYYQDTKNNVYFLDDSKDTNLLPTGYVAITDAQALALQTPLLTLSQAQEDIRSKRTDLLVQSDWTQIADSPLPVVKKVNWTTYRQALRDITKQSTFPTSVVWPTPPV